MNREHHTPDILNRYEGREAVKLEQVLRDLTTLARKVRLNRGLKESVNYGWLLGRLEDIRKK